MAAGLAPADVGVVGPGAEDEEEAPAADGAVAAAAVVDTAAAAAEATPVRVFAVLFASSATAPASFAAVPAATAADLVASFFASSKNFFLSETTFASLAFLVSSKASQNVRNPSSRSNA